MPPEETTIDNARDNLEALIEDVFYHDQEYLITSDVGTPLAVIVSYEAFKNMTEVVSGI